MSLPQAQLLTITFIVAGEYYLKLLIQSPPSINRYFYHCKRVIEAYEAGEVYGTKEFADQVYKSHWRVVDKSKW